MKTEPRPNLRIAIVAGCFLAACILVAILNETADQYGMLPIGISKVALMPLPVIVLYLAFYKTRHMGRK